MGWDAMVIVGCMAIAIGYAVGKMPRWKTWQGYVGLVIVAPVVLVLGVPVDEVLIDCAGLGLGFAWARRG